MSFTDYKITQFTHKIADLPDQPNMPADELKARFDSSPEELRTAHNAVCDDAARLEARVEGIVVETFGDTIDKSMLSDELAAELDAKATQAALSAEQTARESADSSLDTRVSSAESTITTHTTQIAQKCELYVGTYTGNGAASRTINLGFTPRAVLVLTRGMEMYQYIGGQNQYNGGMAVTDAPALGYQTEAVAIVNNGFRVHFTTVSSSNTNVRTNIDGLEYSYIALR